MAFLGIRINHESGRLLSGIDVPGTKVATSEMHITLLHFGDNWPVSEVSKSLEAVYQVISNTKPFLVEAKQIITFPGHGEGGNAVVIKAESNELHSMRKKLAKEFEKQKIDFSKIFKTYKPHITLSYAEKETLETSLKTPIEFSVQEVVLWCGDHGDERLFITFPLKGPEVKKHAMLHQKADLFDKLARHPEQKYFTPTKERRKQDR